MIINYNDFTQKMQKYVQFNQGSLFDINYIYIIVRRKIYVHNMLGT